LTLLKINILLTLSLSYIGSVALFSMNDTEKTYYYYYAENHPSVELSKRKIRG